MSLLPTLLSKNGTELETRGGDEDGATIVGLQDETDVFSVLVSEVAREILIELHSDPGAASELATRVGTSIQNTQYHLEKLMDTEIVEVVGTRYSVKGQEMDVYAPADNSLTMVVGDTECLDSCREALAEPDTE